MKQYKKKTIEDVYQKKAYTGRYAQKLTEPETTCDLTVIIPLFNAQQYVGKCLDSVLQQRTDYLYEILLIDDGSTDDTLFVIREYEQFFPAVKVIRQEHRGPGAARNSGLQASGGRYIAFIDGDDYVAPEYVQRLLDKAGETGADVVKCGYFEVREKYIRRHVYGPACVKGGLGPDILKYPGYIWAGITRRHIWEDICFPEGYWYEDMICRILIFRYADCFACISDILYYHRFHEANISHALLGSASCQCLDQLFLPWELKTYSSEIGLADDEALSRSLAEEWGELLYIRTRRLPLEIRKESFQIASWYMDACRMEGPLAFREKLLLRSFRKRHFWLWNMVNGSVCCGKVWRKIRDRMGMRRTWSR